MRRIVRSRSYVTQLKIYIEEGAATFGAAVASRTLARIDHAIEQHLAQFPATKTPDPRLGLTVYPVRRTPFVVLYDYDDAELRVHLILYERADRRDIDPTVVEW